MDTKKDRLEFFCLDMLKRGTYKLGNSSWTPDALHCSGHIKLFSALKEKVCRVHLGSSVQRLYFLRSSFYPPLTGSSSVG